NFHHFRIEDRFLMSKLQAYFCEFGWMDGRCPVTIRRLSLQMQCLPPLQPIDGCIFCCRELFCRAQNICPNTAGDNPVAQQSRECVSESIIQIFTLDASLMKQTAACFALSCSRNFTAVFHY